MRSKNFRRRAPRILQRLFVKTGLGGFVEENGETPTVRMPIAILAITSYWKKLDAAVRALFTVPGRKVLTGRSH